MLPVLFSGSVVEHDHEGRPARVIGTVTDVSRLKAAENHVHETEVRLEAIVRSAMDAIITVDSDQRIVLFNAAAEKMFGCRAADAIGQPLEGLMPERFRSAHRAHVERFSHTGETSRRMGVQTALWALRADGAEFPIEASISHATVRGTELLTVILRDVTERTAAEQEIRRSHRELRELSIAMAEVRELERTRIARELHDELGQALTALKMDVELLRAALPPARTDLVEQTATMRELLDSTVATTRRISSDLRPLVLDHLGLEAAAQWLAQNFSQRSGLPCDLRVDPSCSALGEPYASALFRIMQESLTNVVRHARAKRVEVRLDRSGPEAVLSVRDDGVGHGARGAREAAFVRTARDQRARPPARRPGADRQRSGGRHDAAGAHPPARRCRISRSVTIRVVIADDHALMREGLRRILATDPAFTVAGEAKDGHEALAAVRAGGFDVLLLDLSMPGRGGIELVRQVKTERPQLQVLVLSMHDEQQFAERAIRAGASGYLTKDTAATQLVAALHKIAGGGLFITPAVAEALAMRLQGPGRRAAAQTPVRPRARSLSAARGGRLA